jgi:hypothetical protein
MCDPGGRDHSVLPREIRNILWYLRLAQRWGYVTVLALKSMRVCFGIGNRPGGKSDKPSAEMPSL